MADKIPLKGIFDSADAATALAEFEPGDVIPIAHGGTGATDLSGAKAALEIPELGARLENIKANNGVGSDDLLSARLVNIATNDGVGSDDLISYTLRNIALNDIVQDEDIFDLDAGKLTFGNLASGTPVDGDEIVYIDQFDGLLKRTLVDNVLGGGGPSVLGKQLIGIPAPAFYGGGSATNPAGETTISAVVGQPPLAVREFATGVERTLFFQVPMPKSWDKGDLSARLFFRSLDGAETGDVVWNVEVSIWNAGADTVLTDNADEVFAIASGHPTARVFKTNEFVVADSINPASITDNALLIVKVSRKGDDALDTHGASMGLIGMHLYYDIDQPTED
jgi:hypothetical protein